VSGVVLPEAVPIIAQVSAKNPVIVRGRLLVQGLIQPDGFIRGYPLQDVPLSATCGRAQCLDRRPTQGAQLHPGRTFRVRPLLQHSFIKTGRGSPRPL